MRRISTRLLTAVGLFIIAATSCKKDPIVDKAQLLIGTWTLAEYGVDANDNNQVDQGELSPVSPSTLSGSISFNSDKTYVAVYNYYGFSDTETGTYTLANNSITTVSSNRTAVVSINALTNNKLILKEAGASRGEWLGYTK